MRPQVRPPEFIIGRRALRRPLAPCGLRTRSNHGPTMPNLTTATPSPAELIARARAMIPRLSERAAAAEAERRLPDQTIAEMQAAGLFRVLQPTALRRLRAGHGDLSRDPAGAGGRRHVDRLGLRRRRRPSLADGAPRRSCRAGCLGPRRHHSGIVLADAGRRGDPGAGRLPSERPLEVLQRLRALRLGVPGREHGARSGGAARPLRAAGAAQRLSDRRYLARGRPQGDRQP